jgi:hypothetical protein
MRAKSLCSSSAFVVSLLLAAGTRAHHSFATHYIVDEEFRLTGTVTDVQLRMPHSFYYVDVTTSDGNTESWEVEAQSIALLRRRGIDRETVAAGDEIEIIGMRSRDPALRVMFANEFVLDSGDRYVMYSHNIPQSAAVSNVQFPDAAQTTVEPDSAPFTERLSGIWQWRAGFPEDQFNRDGRSLLPLNETGLAARAAYDPLNASAINCRPPNFPSMLFSPYLIEFTATPDNVFIDYEYYQIHRDIDFSGQPVADRAESEFGYARGRLEADALIIETDGFPDHPAGLASDWDANGRGTDIPGSAQKRLVEKYRVSADGRFLFLEVTVEDPVYLAEPYQQRRLWERAAEGVVFERGECDVEISRRSTLNAVSISTLE